MDQDQQERIRQRAHEIWESEGRPEGCEAEHWSRAEAELQTDLSGQPDASAEQPPEPELTQTAEPAKPKRTRKPAAKKASAPADPGDGA